MPAATEIPAIFPLQTDLLQVATNIDGSSHPAFYVAEGPVGICQMSTALFCQRVTIGS